MKRIILIIICSLLFYLNPIHSNESSVQEYRLKFEQIHEKYFNKNENKYINETVQLVNEIILYFLNNSFIQNNQIFTNMVNTVFEFENISSIFSSDSKKVIVTIQIWSSPIFMFTYDFIYKKKNNKYIEISDISIISILTEKKLTNIELTILKIIEDNNKLLFLTFGEHRPIGWPIRGSTVLWEWSDTIKPIWWRKGSGKYNTKTKELKIFYCYLRHPEEDEYTEVYKFDKYKFRLIKKIEEK